MEARRPSVESSGIAPPQSESKFHREQTARLKRFYIGMADPTEENLLRACRLLNKLPFESLKKLSSKTLNAHHSPQNIFANEGENTTEREKLNKGTGNTGWLIDDILIRRKNPFDSKEVKLSDAELREIASRQYDSLLKENKKSEIFKLSEAVKNESDLQRRSELGSILAVMIREPGLPEDFLRYNMQISDIARSAGERAIFEDRLEKMPKKDRLHFKILRKKYGAKGANLLLLNGVIEEINMLYDTENYQLKIPEFQVVPASLYVEWKSGKPTEKQLTHYYQQVQKINHTDRSAGVIVRSSAIHSEDGEKVTGAGIYDSVPILDDNLNYNSFKNAVVDVYKSTNSDKARAYRREHGIKEEQMGLIVQDYLYVDNEGYLNTHLPGVPGLTEIVTRRSRNFVKHNELDFYLASVIYSKGFKDAHHFPPDENRVQSQALLALGQRAMILERLWGNSIQLEFVLLGDKFAFNNSINLVQIRDIPTVLSSKHTEIIFPEEKPLHMGAAIGVADASYDILDTHSFNNKKRGLVVLSENHEWSKFGDERKLPKEVVVMLVNSWGANGHIQTICAERGLICIYPGDLSRSDYQGEMPVNINYNEFMNKKVVRVVSNGIEARVYDVNDNEKSAK